MPLSEAAIVVYSVRQAHPVAANQDARRVSGIACATGVPESSVHRRCSHDSGVEKLLKLRACPISSGLAGLPTEREQRDERCPRSLHG